MPEKAFSSYAVPRMKQPTLPSKLITTGNMLTKRKRHINTSKLFSKLFLKLF